MQDADARRCDSALEAFSRRCRRKKRTNLMLSALITVLGVTSFLYGLRLEPLSTIFRWMTVDGTVFTTLGAAAFLAVNLVELVNHTELTNVSVYYLRLSAAVAESVIFIVVLISQLPVFAEHLPVFDRYDSFVMHLLVPVLGVGSFLMNDSPIGRLRPPERWRGTWFVTCYGAVLVTLIATGLLPPEQIPYDFLDFAHSPGLFLAAFAVVYTSAYLMAWGLSVWNRRLSWLWFRNVARAGSIQNEAHTKRRIPS